LTEFLFKGMLKPMHKNGNISRREFLQLAALGTAGLAFRRDGSRISSGLSSGRVYQQIPQGERLGRILATAEVKVKPDADANTIGTLYEDNLVVWLREVTGVNLNREVQRWVETPDGYIWSPRLQPVRNQPNKVLDELPQTSKGPGMWAEVTVPYVDITLENPPARSPWLKANPEFQRLYYSQIVWIDQIRKRAGQATLYRVNELYGSYGDRFWADAEGFRPLPQEEIAPITPDIEDKKIAVDTTYQVLSCYERNSEVYYCRVSTGAKFNDVGERVDKWATPPGTHHTWRKLVSLHMAGGTASAGYDLPGIAWTVLFASGGVAIHSTFWHNNYGVPMSHGCVNARPDDAKWIFRWTSPNVPYDPGDITVQMPGGTPVQVLEE
jgi:lipoprotein-anchoring transpeptidase ErfK/SrfK